MIIRKTTIILFMSNAAAAFLSAAGAGAVWGVDKTTGIGRTVEAVESASQSIGSGPVGLIDAIGGATVAAISAVVSIIQIIFAAPTVALNMGVPSWIVAFAFAPLYVIVALDVIAIMRGDSQI